MEKVEELGQVREVVGVGGYEPPHGTPMPSEGKRMGFRWAYLPYLAGSLLQWFQPASRGLGVGAGITNSARKKIWKL